MNPFNYQVGDTLLYHFYQHTCFGLSRDIPRNQVEKNWVEKLGDLGLWAAENLPKKVWRLMKEPRWLTVVLTQLSMASVSYLFYPKESKLLVEAICVRLPVPTREAVKFGIYLTVIAHIAFAALRAYGRFSNDELMKAWYKI